MSRLLTFYLNMPSMHQAPLISEMAKTWNGPVRVVAEDSISERRLAQGWHRPDFGGADLVVAPDRKMRSALIKDGSSSEAVNLFSGIDAYPETYWSLKQLSLTNSVLGAMAEPGHNLDGIKAPFRMLKHHSLAWRWRKRMDLLLASGHLGCIWWQRAGFPGERILPFGYCVRPAGEDSSTCTGSGPPIHGFRIIYVGQLIYQKGLDVLIQALAMTHAESCFLHIIGNGSEETSYENLAKRQQVDPFIQWHGTMPNEQVLDHMAKADLLVLPSRYDGWGAVVNEALTVGTPVLASDACGASCLLTSDFLGDVFPSGNTSKLAAVLKKRTARGPLPIEERTKIREWAGRSIAPEAVAGYLMEILCRAKSQKSFDGLRPPWERGSPQGSWRNS